MLSRYLSRLSCGDGTLEWTSQLDQSNLCRCLKGLRAYKPLKLKCRGMLEDCCLRMLLCSWYGVPFTCLMISPLRRRSHQRCIARQKKCVLRFSGPSSSISKPKLATSMLTGLISFCCQLAAVRQMLDDENVLPVAPSSMPLKC